MLYLDTQISRGEQRKKEMKPTSFFFTTLVLLFIIIFTSDAPFVNAQTDSCSSSPSINGISFDITNFSCLTAWDAQGFILRFQQTNSTLWSFVLSAPDTNAYISIGFSSDGSMVGSSAIVGWAGSNGGMKQYYLGGTDSSSVKPNQGSLQILSNTAVVIPQSQRIYMAFQLNTTKPEPKLLYAVGPEGQFPTSPEFRLAQHESKVSTTIDYSTGQTGTVQTPYAKLRRSHGVLSMLGWGVLMPIGVIVARYFKQFDPVWFYAHVSIQSGGFILGLAGVICGVVLNDRISANVTKHKALGIVILVLGCLQVTAFLARPDKVSKVRKYWNWYHHGVGRVLIALAVANVFYGIHIGNAGNGWNAGFGVVLAFLFIVAVVLEFRKWARK